MATDIRSKVQGLEPSIRTRDIKSIANRTATIYESLSVITERAKQISIEMKQELHNKLEDFATTSDTIEEILENKEQIEISKFYERLPNPVIIATEEFIRGELQFEYKEGEVKELD